MSNYATLIFNKVIADNDINALSRLGINDQHFHTHADRNTYEFIKNYAEKNGNQAPPLEIIATELPEFTVVGSVDASYQYLARELLNEHAKFEFESVYNSIAERFDGEQANMENFINVLTDELDGIKMRTSVRERVGTSVKHDVNNVVNEYRERKSGKTIKRWKSKYASIGEYVSGNMYTIYGKSGRGKSVIALDECVNLARRGATVLIWSMEMPTFDVLVRIYSYLSAADQTSEYVVDGKTVVGGFEASTLKSGQLSPVEEPKFIEYAKNLINSLEGDITIRGVTDDDFDSRTLAALESDILNTQADVVLLDPFYYMDYEANTSKTAGGDAANTSMRLRRLIGKHSVVCFAITQCDESASEEEGEDREVCLPKRSEVKKTKALLEDAALLIGVDTNYHQQYGKIGINKGRDGGEGLTDDLLYLPQIGLIQSAKEALEVTEFGF